MVEERGDTGFKKVVSVVEERRRHWVKKGFTGNMTGPIISMSLNIVANDHG